MPKHPHERRLIVSDDLLDRARQALGRPDLTVSDVVRHALALTAGVDVAEYTPRVGRPRKSPRPDSGAG